MRAAAFRRKSANLCEDSSCTLQDQAASDARARSAANTLLRERRAVRARAARPRQAGSRRGWVFNTLHARAPSHDLRVPSAPSSNPFAKSGEQGEGVVRPLFER
jgi:hypothetical protein